MLFAKPLEALPPAGIDEQGFVTVGELPQWISIRGRDRGNPIVVIVHGGPGSPYSIFASRLQPLEEHFTLVQWDQRGAGKTYGRHGRRGTGELTFDRLARDGVALVEHVTARLGQERVILVASSAGTITGVTMVRRRPELFAAYVGLDQQADVARGEAIGWARTVERLRAAGKRRAARALEAIGDDPLRWSEGDWQKKQRALMKSDPFASQLGGKLGGALLRSPLHSLGDVRDFLGGLRFSQRRLYDEYITWTARRRGVRFEVPFFVIHGDGDLLTPTSLAEGFFADVDAPHKELVLLPNAGHLDGLLAPARLHAELVARVRPLAVAAARESALRQQAEDGGAGHAEAEERRVDRGDGDELERGRHA